MSIWLACASWCTLVCGMSTVEKRRSSATMVSRHSACMILTGMLLFRFLLVLGDNRLTLLIVTESVVLSIWLLLILAMILPFTCPSMLMPWTPSGLLAQAPPSVVA